MSEPTRLLAKVQGVVVQIARRKSAAASFCKFPQMNCNLGDISASSTLNAT